MTTTVTEEEALWLTVGERPDDRLPRLVAADWYQEREGTVECGECPTCGGTGRVSNGNAEMAEALRATCEKVPWTTNNLRWSWWLTFADRTKPDYLDERLFDALENGVMKEVARLGDRPLYCVYFAAHAAIRELCRAWVKLNKGVSLCVCVTVSVERGGLVRSWTQGGG